MSTVPPSIPNNSASASQMIATMPMVALVGLLVSLL
jgi:hypothetical protein